MASHSQHSSTRTIAPSRRPDGTLRKEIKIKPGFKSEELDASARAYKSRGTALREAATAAIPPSVEEQARLKQAAARAERRKRAKERKQTGWDNDHDNDHDNDNDNDNDNGQHDDTKQGQGQGRPNKGHSDEADVDNVTAQVANTSIAISNSERTKSTTALVSCGGEDADTDANADAVADQAKVLKKLHKKLREIEKLQTDASSGRSLSAAEQSKVSKLATIQKQIEAAQAKLAT